MTEPLPDLAGQFEALFARAEGLAIVGGVVVFLVTLLVLVLRGRAEETR